MTDDEALVRAAGSRRRGAWIVALGPLVVVASCSIFGAAPCAVDGDCEPVETCAETGFCTPRSEGDDGGGPARSDAGGGATDGGRPVDGGGSTGDAGTSDGGGAVDGGAVDGGAIDAGEVDSGDVVDGGEVVDAGDDDAGAVDGGAVVDAGPCDGLPTVTGPLLITNADEAALHAATECIVGDVTFTPTDDPVGVGASSTLSLPALVHVVGNVAVLDATMSTWSVELPALVTIEGDLAVQGGTLGSLDARALVEVEDLIVSTTALKALNLPSLIAAQDVTISDNFDLSTLQLTALTTIGALVVDGNGALSSLSGLPSLLELDSATILDNPVLSHCDAILLRNQTGLPGKFLAPFTVSGNDDTGVDDILYLLPGSSFSAAPGLHEFPGIKCFTKELLILDTADIDAGTPDLYDVSLPDLVAVAGISMGEGGGRLQISNNPRLRSFSAPLLRSHGGHVIIEANPNLTTIELPAFERTAWFFQLLDNDALADLDGLPALELVDFNISIRDNGSLPTTEVCELIARVAAASPNNLGVSVSNNADGGACP